MLARFVPIIRTFAPIVAGIVRMQYKAFVIYNIVGALLWASGVTFLGFYLGEKVPGVEKYLTPIILVIIFVTCIPLAREYFRQREAPSPSA